MNQSLSEGFSKVHDLQFRSVDESVETKEYVDVVSVTPVGMKRYETEIRSGVLYLETDDGWLEVGSMDDICELVGGRTYTIEYSDENARMPWLETDAHGALTVDVEETIADMSYDAEFVGNVETIDEDATDGEYPLRASVFADLMTTIWDSKGDLDSSQPES